MSQSHAGDQEPADDSDEKELERLLVEGVHLHQDTAGISHVDTAASSPVHSDDDDGEGEEDGDIHGDSDIQGALGLFAEATQDMATAALELGLGRHFACVDYCNQVAEKAAQAVSLRRFGRLSRYNHDLRELGALVGAPAEIQDEMAILTPFHPEAFYADTPLEEADEVINAEQASGYLQSAR